MRVPSRLSGCVGFVTRMGRKHASSRDASPGLVGPRTKFRELPYHTGVNKDERKAGDPRGRVPSLIWKLTLRKPTLMLR